MKIHKQIVQVVKLVQKGEFEKAHKKAVKINALETHGLRSFEGVEEC